MVFINWINRSRYVSVIIDLAIRYIGCHHTVNIVLRTNKVGDATKSHLSNHHHSMFWLDTFQNSIKYLHSTWDRNKIRQQLAKSLTNLKKEGLAKFWQVQNKTNASQLVVKKSFIYKVNYSNFLNLNIYTVSTGDYPPSALDAFQVQSQYFRGRRTGTRRGRIRGTWIIKINHHRVVPFPQLPLLPDDCVLAWASAKKRQTKE